jgi:hypothetical protein
VSAPTVSESGFEIAMRAMKLIEDVAVESVGKVPDTTLSKLTGVHTLLGNLAGALNESEFEYGNKQRRPRRHPVKPIDVEKQKPKPKSHLPVRVAYYCPNQGCMYYRILRMRGPAAYVECRACAMYMVKA